MTHISHLLTLGLLLLPLTVVPATQWGFLICRTDDVRQCRVSPSYDSRESATSDSDGVNALCRHGASYCYATSPVSYDEALKLVDGGGEVDQPQQQTTTINSEVVAIAVDYHAALLLACSDLIHRKDVSAVEACAKSYLARIIKAQRQGKEER